MIYDTKYFFQKNKTLSELPPTPLSIQGHRLRFHYIVNVCLNLLSNVGNHLNSLKCGRILSSEYMSDQFILYMPEMFTTTWL